MQANGRRIVWRRLGTVALVCTAVAGCTTGASPRPASATAAPSTVEMAPGDLMGSADRARLEALVTERAGGSVDEGYRIGPDDLLDVRIPDMPGMAPAGAERHDGVAPVAGAPQFQQGLRVSAGGDIAFPLIGFVRAEGLTTQELEGAIGERLKVAGILRAPQVNILVAEYRSRVVAVVGSVERPGLYPVTRPGATLADMIWAAGGPTRDAGRIVAFTPAGGAPGGRTALRTPMAMAMTVGTAGPLAARSAHSEASGRGRRVRVELTRAPNGMRAFVLQAPPRVVIDLAGATVGGGATATFSVGDDPFTSAVRTAGHDGSLRVVVDLRSGPPAHAERIDGTTLVIDLGETATEPVRTAERHPVAPPAAAPRARAGGDREIGPIRIDLALLLGAPGLETAAFNPSVRAGDVVNVSPAGSVQVSGWVEKPGAYPVTRNLTLSGAVAAAGGENFAARPGGTRIARVLGPDERRNFTVDLGAVADGRVADIPIIDGDVVYVPISPVKAVPWALWGLANSMLRVGATVF